MERVENPSETGWGNGGLFPHLVKREGNECGFILRYRKTTAINEEDLGHFPFGPTVFSNRTETTKTKIQMDFVHL